MLGMLRFLFLTALAFGLAPISFGRAAGFEAAPNASYTIDLDTEDGNLSVWRLDDLSGVSAARAQVTVRRLGRHKRWAPSFGFDIGNSTRQVRFRIIAHQNSSRLTTLVNLREGSTEVETARFDFGPELGETFAFEMDWTGDGEVSVTIRTKSLHGEDATERHELALGGAPLWFEAFGSTGEMSAEPLQLGRTVP